MLDRSGDEEIEPRPQTDISYSLAATAVTTVTRFVVGGWVRALVAAHKALTEICCAVCAAASSEEIRFTQDL